MRSTEVAAEELVRHAVGSRQCGITRWILARVCPRGINLVHWIARAGEYLSAFYVRIELIKHTTLSAINCCRLEIDERKLFVIVLNVLLDRKPNLLEVG